MSPWSGKWSFAQPWRKGYCLALYPKSQKSVFRNFTVAQKEMTADSSSLIDIAYYEKHCRISCKQPQTLANELQLLFSAEGWIFAEKFLVINSFAVWPPAGSEHVDYELKRQRNESITFYPLKLCKNRTSKFPKAIFKFMLLKTKMRKWDRLKLTAVVA